MILFDDAPFCLSANVNGGWNDWSDWSTCSMTSSGLTKTRSRRCNNPAPEGDGLACLGVSVESDACDIIDCPSKFNVFLPTTFPHSFLYDIGNAPKVFNEE